MKLVLTVKANRWPDAQLLASQLIYNEINFSTEYQDNKTFLHVDNTTEVMSVIEDVKAQGCKLELV